MRVMSAEMIHREVHGDSAQRERVLLVMGLGMPGQMWAPLLPQLQDHYAVAWFDHRGVGRTPGPARTSMADLATDSLTLLDSLGWDQAHLVGISMGGMIAQHLALTWPHRFRSLSLLATHAGGPLGLLPPLEGVLAALTPGSRTKRLQRLLHPPDVRPAMAARSEGAALAPLATVRAHLRAVRGHDTRHRLGEISVPCLVFKPERDVLVRPAHSDRLVQGIPGAKLAVFPQAGHGLIAHATDAVGTALRAHFAATGGAGAERVG